MSNAPSSAPQQLVMVTGPSGAGRSTAINAFEDMGYEVIDSLPLSMISRLLSGPPLEKPLALGVAPANREFSTNGLIELIDSLAETAEIRPEVVYLDSTADVLLRRYSETRRRHPSAPEESPELGIEREMDLLLPIKARADVLIDTSELTVHDLKADLERLFSLEDSSKLALTLHSFSYKRGLPRGIDMVFDCRFLRNPYWDPALRGLNGQSAAVQSYVSEDPRYEAFFSQVISLAELLLPAYREEGKAHLSIAFGCTGGQHRSVSLAEHVASALAEAGWQVSIRHRELERSGQDSAPSVGQKRRT
ncbi:MAG: RNase adapter RapZ [Pseudomonadota bacterium]